MSRQANPTLIGGFVVGAVVLAVAGVAYFGGESFLAERFTFVAFFDGSMKGLNIGAPVTFRGVRIGAVSDIVVRYDSQDGSVRIPVYFQIEQGRIEPVRARSSDPYQNVRILIEEGLRAQLAVQSFVTGQIAVQLNFQPDEPAKYVGADPHTLEFPTVQSTAEKMGKALEDFDLHGLLQNLESTVAGINELATSPKLRNAVASLDTTINDIGELARSIDAKVDPIAQQIDATAAAARHTLDQVTNSVSSIHDALEPALEDARRLLQNVDSQVDPVVVSFVRTAEATQVALEQARVALATASHDLGEDSIFYRRIISAIEELAAAARSVRSLAELLEQQPEALLQGRNTLGTR